MASTGISLSRGSHPIIGIWFVIGLVVLAYLHARHPQRLPEMKRVFADDVLPSTETVSSK